MGIMHQVRHFFADPDKEPTLRSSEWPKVRKEHLTKFPTCAACGGKDKLEVHHKVPFHLDKAKELDPTNLITLCEGNKTVNCHLIFGHFFNYQNYNPSVEADAAHFLEGKSKKHDPLMEKVEESKQLMRKTLAELDKPKRSRKK